MKRELELCELLKTENLDVMILTETDSNMIKSKEDYRIEGYETVIQLRKDDNEKTRLVMLIRVETAHCTKVRSELMSPDFPSIWLEYCNKGGMSVLICGFYREWSRNGHKLTEEEQVNRIEILTEQMERATNEDKDVIILGDANACSQNWKDSNFKHKKVSEEMNNSIEICGMVSMDMGITYTADGIGKNGIIAESGLDHIYASKSLTNRLNTFKKENAGTDHRPIIAEIRIGGQIPNKPKIVVKRNMRNFNKESWLTNLAKQKWEELGETEDPNLMAKSFDNLVKTALDECAPFTSFKIRAKYKLGLTPECKRMMAERDALRKNLKKVSATERKAQMIKYKKLRNKVNSQTKKENVKANEDRVNKAKNENEIWKVVKDITNPKSESNWKLKENDEEITEEGKVADVFNNFFVQKIAKLKENIDSRYVEDPLQRLKKKMEGRNLKFSLKQVTERKVLKVIKSMKQKRSAGRDGLSQENLILGSEILCIPLTRIINKSLEIGEFPEVWKEAAVTPILKKGSSEKKENYRPVSCLPVASKVLEKIVTEQMTQFLEEHKLLPNNQHGFRENRSTMSALSSMQKEWTENSENKKKTGILLWDLSAAFDTLDVDLLCKKLKIYGFDKLTCKWFSSFLTGRSQRVRIGNVLSERVFLTSGVPQGGILSPIIFIVYGADMSDWVCYSSLYGYADDTSSSICDEDLSEILRKLEIDADRILRFMASNGLVANPSKTTFMVLNQKSRDLLKVKVGECEITQVRTTKLLGMNIDDDQEWKSHFFGKGGLIPSLNKRLFCIRRLKNHIGSKALNRVAESIWTSKARYGLQLCTEVRLNETQSINGDLKKVQMAQNKLLRCLNGSLIKDRISVKTLLEKQNMLSINQLAAQEKLTEMWKAVNTENYPIQMAAQSVSEVGMATRADHQGRLIEVGHSKITTQSFVGDASRVWNKAPSKIKEAKTIGSAQNAIKAYCKTIPI